MAYVRGAMSAATEHADYNAPHRNFSNRLSDSEIGGKICTTRGCIAKIMPRKLSGSMSMYDWRIKIFQLVEIEIRPLRPSNALLNWQSLKMKVNFEALENLI